MRIQSVSPRMALRVYVLVDARLARDKLKLLGSGSPPQAKPLIEKAQQPPIRPGSKSLSLSRSITRFGVIPQSIDFTAGAAGTVSRYSAI
jgi:hypothetical protein